MATIQLHLAPEILPFDVNDTQVPMPFLLPGNGSVGNMIPEISSDMIR